MKKQELVDAIAELAPPRHTKQMIRDVLDALSTAVVQKLAAGEEVALSGIGKLAAVATPARKRRNPQTGETVDVPAGRKVKFKASSTLRAQV